ncbi:MAG: hypothetical protein B7Z55_01980 [Planctomycetales bacterium 12-60-4]|nr:MAG: hypothetical protein B7Z55_01980 [Planctomycetales bacterium 12-60-4]
MKFAAASSQEPDLTQAIAAVQRELVGQLDGAAVDLVMVFVSHEHRAQFPTLAAQLHEHIPSRVLLGSVAETIIAGECEWESGPAIAVWAAALPEYELRPFDIQFESTPDGVICSGIPEELADDADRVRAFLMLGEPYSSAPNAVIDRFGDEFPETPVIGGMASGASSPGENCLFFGNDAVPTGAVVVALLDGPPIYTLVSQGCRPVGETYVVTRAERNVVLELGGKPALQRVQEVYQAASAEDKKLLESGLHLGVAMSEYRDSFGRGDFLVANVLGADRNSGAIATGNHVRKGQTVQFHVRDAASADVDLTSLLERTKAAHPSGVEAALLFSCNGRGSRMFPEAHHDASAIQRVLGPLPLAGMFAAGEIGPVGPQNYMHGFTASVALFVKPR